MDDLAEADRRRLDQLLDYGQDPALAASTPGELSIDEDTGWTAGYEDPELGVQLTVVFIRDSQRRDDLARRLQDDPSTAGAVRVSTNGGMLLYGTAPSSDRSSAAFKRLRELASRFAGRE